MIPRSICVVVFTCTVTFSVPSNGFLVLNADVGLKSSVFQNAFFPQHPGNVIPSSRRVKLDFTMDDDDDNRNPDMFDESIRDDDSPIIIRGSDEDDLSDEIWETAEMGQPSQWMIIKQLLGINMFTYFLAGSIAFFLLANFLLGPGWLGQSIGLSGTGTFTETSTSLPDNVDLNNPDFFL